VSTGDEEGGAEEGGAEEGGASGAVSCAPQMYTAPASYLVQMAFSLPIDFTAEKNTKFVNVIANVAGLQMADVTMTTATTDVRIDTTLTAKDKDTADSIAAKLTQQDIDAALTTAGMSTTQIVGQAKSVQVSFATEGTVHFALHSFLSKIPGPRVLSQVCVSV